MNAVGKNTHTSKWIPWTLIFGITASTVPVAYAAPGEVNSINNGQNIQAGTYFNTAGSRTTFQNQGGSLHLRSGDLVRGLESNISGTPNGNGGALYFKANVVRLDGTIDASAVRNGSLYTGNGGKVVVDSNYLFQNGNIFANGANGGLVQFNVGAMTLGSNARITAQGFGGNGGAVVANSAGVVDLQAGSIIDTSGKVAGTFDTNVINIEGGAFNNQGILRANGLSGTDLKPNNGDAAVMLANPQLANNPVPPPISLGTGTNDTSMPNILFGPPGSADFRGGTVRLVATGQSLSVANDINNSAVFSTAEKSNLNNRNGQVISFNQGDVFQRGLVETNGGVGKNGGTVIIAAARNVINGTTIQANGANSVDGVFNTNGNGGNGGNGGAIILTAMNSVNNTGSLQANGGNGAIAATVNTVTGNNNNANATVNGVGGAGGTGGLIAFNSNTSNHTGNLQANGGIGGGGGHANTFDTESAAGGNPTAIALSNGGVGGQGGRGGLVVFSGNANPTGSGIKTVNGGQGGRGGNAWADSRATSSTGNPVADATANAGAGGTGGAAGSIIAVIPGSLTNFSTRSGGTGNSGLASFREVSVLNGVSTTQTGSTPMVSGSVTSGNNNTVLATRRNEYLSHAENGVLLTQAGGAGNLINTLSGRLNDSLIRTVLNPNGSSGANGAALANAQASGNFVVSSGVSGLGLNNNLVNSNLNPLFFRLNTLTLLNNGNIDNNMLWTPGVHLVGEGFHDFLFSLGGGHISWLANGNITNNQITMTRGLWGGGSIHLAATQDIINNNGFITIGPNKALLSAFQSNGPTYEFSHSGSSIFKAGRDIVNATNGKIQSNDIFFDIHPPLRQNPPIEWPKFLNGAQIGAKIYLLADRNLVNNGLLQSDALTYRHGADGASNPALAQGGIIIGRHRTGSFINNGTLSANGNAFFSPNENNGPRFNTNTFPAATSFNGTIDIP
ncbi:beta strand repeat-containing protein [Vampirovibrio sp.]|uniref:beta strand repeat-containing protein n=1 Tax=Vampirovibrio sp. TaxID=2717857 RepID=UPI0035933715